jgi:hypothetical protein
VEKRSIDEFIRKHHLPEEWGVPSADEYLESLEPKNGKDTVASAQQTAPQSAEKATQEAPVSNAKRIEYPWPTAEAADGPLIVGVRPQGRWGTNVCIETVD